MLLLTCPLLAQLGQRTGNIYGKIVDEEGIPLPGVKVTLTGSYTAPITTISSDAGLFRFLRLSPGVDYSVKAEIEGFKTFTRGDIFVQIGRNTEIIVNLELGMLEEEITVVAASPVVESKSTTVAETVTREILQSLPTSRDPWVVLQQAASVMIDRENVGGSESGQQSLFYAKGGGLDQWAMDGVVITDASSGGSVSYFDFDAFEEMNITLGGADVTIQGGGIALNLVTRRGGNKVSLGGRFYLTDQKLQAENITDELIAEGVVGTNVIRNIKDYGFNMGGPLFKDKAWWWMSYGVQDIKTNNLYGVPDDTLLQNYAAKINLQLVPENRFEAFAHVGGKEKFGRSSSLTFPGGWHQFSKYHFGSPIYKIQDEHMFGDNLFVHLRWSFVDSGFNFRPMDDLGLQEIVEHDVTTGIDHNTYYYYAASRPSHAINFQANYFNDDLLGASHDIRVGFDWRRSEGAHTWTYPGNVQVRYNYNTLTVDTDGDALPDLVPGIKRVEFLRGWSDNNLIKMWGAYFSDTITFGRFNLILGLRYDRSTPAIQEFSLFAVEPDFPAWSDNFSSTTISALDAALPGLDVSDVKPDYDWTVLSPRVGLTYDVFGDGKTIAKLSFARYGEWMGTGEAEYFAPGGLGGWMDFWWFDAVSLGGNGDGFVDVTELRWNLPGAYVAVPVFDSSGNMIVDEQLYDGEMWAGYDFDNPQAVAASRYTVGDNAGSEIIWEGIFTVEREVMPDFAVALDFTYRRFDHILWDVLYDPDTGDKEDPDEYVEVGTIPSSVDSISTGEGGGKPYYLRAAGVPYRYDLYRETRPGYYRDYKGVELRLNKRLSNKWMLNASFCLQDQKVHAETGAPFNPDTDVETYNPTNRWAIDGKAYAPELGASSGKVGMRVFSKWMLKLSGLYQLPYEFNVSFTFTARQGYIVRHTLTIDDVNAPNAYDKDVDVYLSEFGAKNTRLPNFWNLNLRLEKVIPLGDTGRIYIMADLFNPFNRAVINRRYEQNLGTYTPHDGYFAPEGTNWRANEVLNPRVLRLGVRFQF